MTSQSLIPADAGLDLMTLGQVLAQSGYFTDAKTQAQAVTKILYGQEMGISAIASLVGIHIIQGKPAPSAGLIASVIRRSTAYDYRVLTHTDDECSIEFVYRGERAGVSTFTMADARRAGLPSTNKVWTQYPRNLLFARAMSNGARWYCADIFGGVVYTPEELGAVVDGEGHVISVPKAASVSDPAEEMPDPAELIGQSATQAAPWLANEPPAVKLPHPEAVATDETVTDRDGSDAAVWLVGGLRCITLPNPKGGRFLLAFESCPDHAPRQWVLGPDQEASAWRHSLGAGSPPCRRVDVMPLTAEHRQMIAALAGDAGISDQQLIERCQDEFRRGPGQLSLAQADELVAALSETVAVVAAFD